jgi:glyoxylase-like metal-dependent hydrolase (beta-lactamase superfamily II)
LHKDHAGGVSLKDRLGHYHITFPDARYYLQEKELQFAMETGFPSFMTDELGVLEDRERVVLLNGNGTIDGYIQYEVTGAHTPYHQVFWIREEGQTIFFGGDDAPQLQQMKSRFVAKYDYDGKKAMQLRQRWWMEGKEKGWTFLFYHDVKTPTFKP